MLFWLVQAVCIPESKLRINCHAIPVSHFPNQPQCIGLPFAKDPTEVRMLS